MGHALSTPTCVSYQKILKAENDALRVRIVVDQSTVVRSVLTSSSNFLFLALNLSKKEQENTNNASNIVVD